MAVVTPIAFVTTGTVALRMGRIMVVTLAPLVLIVLSYIAAFVASPNTHENGFQSHYQMFFSSTAVVLATVLVTLVVQASLFTSPGIRPAALLGIFYIVCGEVAATMSLSPGLDPVVAHHAFALAVSAGAGSLAAVFFIATKLLGERSFEIAPSTDGAVTLEPSEARTVSPPPAIQASTGTSADEGAATAMPKIRLTPEAKGDLSDLGGLTTRTVGSLMRQFFADPDELAAHSEPLQSTGRPDWRVLPLGNLRAIYRPVTSDQPTQTERAPGVLIARLIPRRELSTAVETLSTISIPDAQGSGSGEGGTSAQPPAH